MAVSGDEIWATKGIYKTALCGTYSCVCTSTCTNHSDAHQASFTLKPDVKIFGGFDGTENALYLRDADPDPYTVNSATDSVLSGDLNGNDFGTDPADSSRSENSNHVVTATGTDRTAILDGFTITGGHDNNYAYDSGGGGIRLNANSRATIRNSAIISNFATGGAGESTARATKATRLRRTS